MSQQRWEYLVWKHDHTIVLKENWLLDLLNEKGQEGWELVTNFVVFYPTFSRHDDPITRLIFKRRIEESKQ